VTIGDARVISALAGMAQKIGIVCYNHTSFTPEEVQMDCIILCTETRLHRRGNVDSMPA
jgi:hypothetical protein